MYVVRDVWFDRLTLRIARQMIFDLKGEILSDARYSDWKAYDGVPFPKVIDIKPPKDGYGVSSRCSRPILTSPLATTNLLWSSLRGRAASPRDQAESAANAPSTGDSSASRKKTPH